MNSFGKKITARQVAVAFTIIGSLATFALFVRNIQAQSQGQSRLNAFAWYIPSVNVSGLHTQEFLGLRRISGVSSSVQNINDFRNSNKNAWGQALVNQMTASAQQNPNAIQVMGFMSHGDPGSYYTATGFRMPTEVAMVTAAYQNANVQGISIVDCCGSGNVASYVQKNGYGIYGDGLNNLGSITSSAPGVSSWVGNDSSVAGKLARLRGNMSEVDANGDGVATMAELKDAFAKKNWDNQFIIPPGNEGAPVLASSDEAMKEYMKKWRGTCAVVKPGQDEAFGKAVWGMDNVFKNDDTSGKPVDINGNLATLKESDLNFELRKNNFGCLNWSMEQGKSTDPLQQPGCNPKEKTTSNYDILETEATKNGGKKPDWASGAKYNSLSEDQAKQALADALHAYTVPEDKTMKPTFYTKGSRTYDAKNEVVFVRREDCKFVTPPSPLPFASPKPSVNDSPFNNSRSNSGGNQGGQNPNGQQGNNNGQASPNPYASPIPGTNSSVVCSYNYAPVCDFNGQTQPNECVATQQNKVAIKHTGACTDTDKKQSVTDISALSDLIKQVVTSGIPESTIASIVQSIVNLFSNYISGNTAT